MAFQPAFLLFVAESKVNKFRHIEHGHGLSCQIFPKNVKICLTHLTGHHNTIRPPGDCRFVEAFYEDLYKFRLWDGVACTTAVGFEGPVNGFGPKSGQNGLKG